MSTRAPLARRAATMRAMLVQLGSDETLVPPNFRTIQAEGGLTVSLQGGMGRRGPAELSACRGGAASVGARAPWL